MGNEISEDWITPKDDREHLNEVIIWHLRSLTDNKLLAMFPGWEELSALDKKCVVVQLIAESDYLSEPFLVENKTKAWKLA